MKISIWFDVEADGVETLKSFFAWKTRWKLIDSRRERKQIRNEYFRKSRIVGWKVKGERTSWVNLSLKFCLPSLMDVDVIAEAKVGGKSFHFLLEIGNSWINNFIRLDDPKRRSLTFDPAQVYFKKKIFQKREKNYSLNVNENALRRQLMSGSADKYLKINFFEKTLQAENIIREWQIITWKIMQNRELIKLKWQKYVYQKIRKRKSFDFFLYFSCNFLKSLSS